MKKLISLILVTVMLVTALMTAPVSVSAAAVFHEGDVLYLCINNPENWATIEGTVLYANFTDATRAENGGKSVVIANADKSRYAPVTGVVPYESETGAEMYCYTVTAADEGASCMRFWRGNTEKLWNESVLITADDWYKGLNTAVVTDWSDTGRLICTAQSGCDPEATLTLSATKGEVGDSFDITLTHNEIEGAVFSYEISINNRIVSTDAAYTFTPGSNGVYAVSATVIARDASGKTLASDIKYASITVGESPVTVFEPDQVYAHAAAGSSDKEAWVKWRWTDSSNACFFLPSSAKAYDAVELYNTHSESVIINGVEIPSGGIVSFAAEADKSYRASIEPLDLALNVTFLFSSAEAALWVNNTDVFDPYSDFFEYLKADKANSVAASGAIATPDGKVESTDVKKMKGRGNTSWNADKKGFNITFKSSVSVAGMDKGKKYSLVSNFQDAAMARNRILFDLSDEVGIPYSSDSRFIDLYTNGEYQGTYQMCQKIEVGPNCLISDFAEDDYLDVETGGVKDDFCFVAEIDSSPADDDFTISARNGNNLTMKAPELTIDDPCFFAVDSYISEKYNTMYSNLQSSSIGDYLDITSMAKVYLINELGKNWDSGASSFYFTYKPDKNGSYKFFASPVWDYDNSLGNANGVSGDLRRLGITDYTLPSGWFATKKNGYNGPNVLAESVRNPLIMAEVRRVWFEDFLPALAKLNTEGCSTGEIYSADVYANILRGTAAMNYKIWELVTNTAWIADHSSLRQYRAAYTTNEYGQVTGVDLTQDAAATAYNQYSFDGQFDYMMDWMNSRAAWMSARYIDDYVPSEPDVQPTEPPTEPPTEKPALPPEDVIIIDLTNSIAAWVFDATDKVAGDKLKEYGSADDGYQAVVGNGRMTLSVSGTKSRALEWSTAEYGKSGTLMTPIMAAGSKNQWGEPYVNLHLPTVGYDRLKLTMYLAGSNKAPASWKLQYSTNGVDFTDIEGKEFTISADSRKTLTAYFDHTDLPDFAYDNNDSGVDLRLVPVSMTTVDGGDALATPTDGELAINAVVVDGRQVAYGDVVMGDTDGSGDVEIIDVTYLQRYLATITRLTSSQQKASDVDRDGDPNIIDATIIQRALAGIKNDHLTL